VSDLIVSTFIPNLFFSRYLYCVLSLEESLYFLAYIFLQLMKSTFGRCANLHVFDRHLIVALFSSHAVASCPVSHGPCVLLSVCQTLVTKALTVYNSFSAFFILCQFPCDIHSVNTSSASCRIRPIYGSAGVIRPRTTWKRLRTNVSGAQHVLQSPVQTARDNLPLKLPPMA
jgi:hypothetical protein